MTQRSELSLSDNWETPKALYDWLCYRYNFRPVWDVCATKQNSKCGLNFWDKEEDGLHKDWSNETWMNPPHSQTEWWVKKACSEFLDEGVETMAIIPANSMCTSYAEACIEPHAEYHPIFERPRFNLDGKPAKDPSRNSYFVVIWRKK